MFLSHECNYDQRAIGASGERVARSCGPNENGLLLCDLVPRAGGNLELCMQPLKRSLLSSARFVVATDFRLSAEASEDSHMVQDT